MKRSTYFTPHAAIVRELAQWNR